MKKYSLLALLLITLFAACTDPYEGTTFLRESDDELDMTCAAYLTKNEEDFSLWVELLKYADYYNALNDADAKATVFCPTNDAMHSFLQWKGVENVRELDKEYAKAVAQIHILNFDLSDAELIKKAESSETIEYQTLFKTYLTTGFGYTITDVDDADLDDTIFNSDSIYLNNQAKLQKFTATKTSNGEIFTMGDVIRPVAETILERLRPYEEYNIFIEAAERCGYDKIVAREIDTTANADGSLSFTAVNFTCLAVPDEVYAASGIHSVDDLCSYLGAGSDYTSTDNALYHYIAYHFLDKIMYVSNFFDFSEEGQINVYDTEYTYQVITCQDINGEHIFNKEARILRSDMLARNGVIHKIDYILPVWEPDPVTIIWDFCNTAEIISFVNAYGADQNLGAVFSSPLTTREIKVDFSEERRGNYGNLSFVQGETYVSNSTRASYSSYPAIGFLKSGSRTDYKANMNNLFVVNLGYAGWVEFKTPTIIKGRYKVELFYGGNPTLYSFYGSGSRTRFIIDDETINDVYIYKGLLNQGFTAATYGTAPIELWKEIEFENSETHTFRGQMMDINAKTNSRYHQLWDYVKFTPID